VKTARQLSPHDVGVKPADSFRPDPHRRAIRCGRIVFAKQPRRDVLGLTGQSRYGQVRTLMTGPRVGGSRAAPRIRGLDRAGVGRGDTSLRQSAASLSGVSLQADHGRWHAQIDGLALLDTTGLLARSDRDCLLIDRCHNDAALSPGERRGLGREFAYAPKHYLDSSTPRSTRSHHRSSTPPRRRREVLEVTSAGLLLVGRTLTEHILPRDHQSVSGSFPERLPGSFDTSTTSSIHSSRSVSQLVVPTARFLSRTFEKHVGRPPELQRSRSMDFISEFDHFFPRRGRRRSRQWKFGGVTRCPCSREKPFRK